GGPLNFVGNVEGKDLPRHLADVVVCDATVGNVVMKFFEGVAQFILDEFRKEFKRPPWGPIGYLFMRPGIGRIRRRFDYESFGGAVLLGVNGNVIITHGRAKQRMIGYAVGVAAAAARARVPLLIGDALGSGRGPARGAAEPKEVPGDETHRGQDGAYDGGPESAPAVTGNAGDSGAQA
ncbi:MAG: hypothetical protein MUP67_06285, partial [Acidimicrobiia bacterium]|nr:hypothetical protein [Acidimicrobiia bacterium]